MSRHRSLALLAVAGLVLVAARVAAEGAPAVSKPNPNSAAEPLVAQWSPARSAAFLDGVALGWTREKKCGTCHTNYPYLMARPLLGEDRSALKEVRSFFEDRVANWDRGRPGDKPRWDTEVVATAVTLAFNDAHTTGRLHPRTRQALDRMWTLQQANGGWNWIKCDWPPFEHDDYFGAVFAALGAGVAPDDYARTEPAREGLDNLRAYFDANPPPDLHHQALLLWASLRVPGLMTAAERAETVKQLLALQRADGGWSLPALGGWKRKDKTANDRHAPSDGYGTGLVVYVLRQAGVPADGKPLRRGVAWLKTHQRDSGRWFTRSLNNDKYHYITHAGTCFAVLALAACEAEGK
jgi:squalene-hopene/tetraprenyl-beta-curcumene cyclase